VTSPLSQWNHVISNLSLADPEFGTPGRVELLLGADIYANINIIVAWPAVCTPRYPYCT
jgi:hypothetical protein